MLFNDKTLGRLDKQAPLSPCKGERNPEKTQSCTVSSMNRIDGLRWAKCEIIGSRAGLLRAAGLPAGAGAAVR